MKAQEKTFFRSHHGKGSTNENPNYRPKGNGNPVFDEKRSVLCAATPKKEEMSELRSKEKYQY